MGEIALSLRDLREPSFAGRLSSDERLARMASRGSTQAFAALYERHHQSLFRYCRSIVREPEDAQDALQSTMMRAFAALSTGERDLAVRPWLFRIAHNESISILRRRRTDEVVPEEQPGGFDVERAVDQRERLTLLVADLRTLVERQRAALVMRELSGLSIEEIAAVLSCSPGAAKQALFEARTALHEMSEGRAMGCETIRRAISARDGRVLRGRKLRAHLRACASCREFEASIGARRADLRALVPPLPAVAGTALLRELLASSAHAGSAIGTVASAGTNAGGATVAGTDAGGAGLTGTGATGAGVASTSTGGTILGGHLTGSLAAKALVGAAIVATATGAAHLALGPARSKHPAAERRSTNDPGISGTAATPAKRASLAVRAPGLPSGLRTKAHAARATSPLGASNGRHSALALGRVRLPGAHGDPLRTSTVHVYTHGKGQAVGRPTGTETQHGGPQTGRQRSSSADKARKGHGDRGGGRPSERPSEVGKANAQAHRHGHRAGHGGSPAPRSHPSGGSEHERPSAQMHP